MATEIVKPEASEQSVDPLRDTFVGMLFALTVAQVAVNAGIIVSRPEPFQRKLPAYSHLLVALLLTAASWVGWSRSKSPGRSKAITSVFSRSFVGLLLDVFLVIIYFIIVQYVEGLQLDKPITPSAKPESQWLGWVFLVYVVWDLWTDIFVAGGVPRHGLAKISVGLKAVFVSTFSSLVCLLMVGVIYYLSSKTTTVQGVVALDIALCAVIFFFRAVKGLEAPLAAFFKVSDLPAFNTPRQLTPTEQIMGGVCFLCYFLILLFRPS